MLVGQSVPIVFQLIDGNTTRFVRATVKDPAGVQVAGSPFTLSHVGGGEYKYVGYVMPNVDYVTAKYEAFTDNLFSIPDPINGAAIDTFVNDDNTTLLSQAIVGFTRANELIGYSGLAASQDLPSIVKGADKDLIVRIIDGPTLDPLDLTNADIIRACFIESDGSSLHKFFLKKTAAIVLGSDIVTLDVTNIAEGMPIYGVGIPSGSVVLKTPTSTTSPSSAGTIKISANASQTVSETITIGDIIILNSPFIGKISIHLDEGDTDSLEAGSAQNFEVLVQIGEVTSYVQFPSSLEIKERYC